LSLELARASTEATGVNPKEFQKKFGKGPKQWFASTSSYNALTDPQKVSVVASLKATSSLILIQAGLVPPAVLYPECPLNFLFEGLAPRGVNVKLESFQEGRRFTL
jgi:hypothetical protein